MRRSQIKIALAHGTQWRPCLARKNGLAIAKSPFGEPGWSITQVATGRRLNRLSLLPLPTARVAVALATACGDWGCFAADTVPPRHVLDALNAIAEMAEAE